MDTRKASSGRWLVAGAAAIVATAGVVTLSAWAGPAGESELAIPVRVAPAVNATVTADLASAPSVPAPITRDYPARVVVNLDVIEKEMPIADGTTYRFWTFGGTVPGKFIRVREGDQVELHLNNAKDSQMPHNIDLHAVTGPGGGAGASITMPGEHSVFRFAALNPGLYVYHCAMPGMVGMHIANGMYGMILVEPKEGLPPVDHEFYIMQGDFYTNGAPGQKGLVQYDNARAMDERPDYVVFNGRVGSMAGEHALQVKKGETVRLFVGNGGPNLTSSFHVIGEIFDNLYVQGGSQVSHDVQTTTIPAGGATIVEFRAEQPGDYAFVDHAIFRAGKGAVGTIHVSGDADLSIFDGKNGPMGH
jgi:nitrite reductase (NO-forming)